MAELITKGKFAKQYLTVKYHQWWRTLKGERNLSYPDAKVASQVLGTEVDVWLDITRQAERQAAWQKFGGK